MERLFVFADFNWLGKAELVGELCYEKKLPKSRISLGIFKFFTKGCCNVG